MTALSLKDLTKIYPNGAIALNTVSLDVAEGELLVVLGPSGSGKSTLLRLIAGLEQPTGGDIFIDEKRANNLPPRDRDIAMVFQDYALYPHFSVSQNLGFGLKMRRFSKREIKARIDETARLLGISDLLDRKPRELSGGQRQRVALGRALARNPKVFLFDEPLSNLDPSLRVQLRREIKQIHDRIGATMVYVTHDQYEAMLIGQRIAILRAGMLEQTGTAADLYRRPTSRFVAGFFGTPPMNFVECTAVAGSECVEVACGDAIRFRLQSDGVAHPPSRISIGFRPEDVGVGASAGEHSLSGNARVISVEAMGGETVVHLEDAQSQFCARFLGFPPCSLDDRIAYSIPCENLHLFDKESGRRIEGRLSVMR